MVRDSIRARQLFDWSHALIGTISAHRILTLTPTLTLTQLLVLGQVLTLTRTLTLTLNLIANQAHLTRIGKCRVGTRTPSDWPHALLRAHLTRLD